MSEGTIAAILAALLPVAVTALFAWFERRSQEVRRNAAIDTAHKRVQFLNTYLTTQQMILPPERYDALKQTIGTEVERIFQELAAVLGEIERTIQQTRETNVVQRIFLLYRMRTSQSNLFRALFYALLVISTIISLLFTIGAATLQETNIITAGIGIAILLLPFIFLALLFRWLALKRNRDV
jgi:hypothetical protein